MTIEQSIYLGYSRDAASVNANLQVRKLREELAESQEKYAEMEKVKGASAHACPKCIYIYMCVRSVKRTFTHK